MGDVIERTCEGACCAVFTLADGFSDRAADIVDSEFILDMLIPLEREEALERAERFGVPLSQAEGSEGYTPHTCRHWDERTRLCTVYEQRPEMCRDYPYEKECSHGCSFTACAETQEKWREMRQQQAAKKAEA